MDVKANIKAGLYKNPMTWHSETKKEFRAKESELRQNLRKDLAKEHDIPFGAIEQKLWYLAEQAADGESMDNLAHDYEELADFVHLIISNS